TINDARDEIPRIRANSGGFHPPYHQRGRNRAQRRSINSATYYHNRRIGGYERLELRFALRSQDFAVARRDDHDRGVARRNVDHRRYETKQKSLPQDLDAGKRQESHQWPASNRSRERATE